MHGCVHRSPGGVARSLLAIAIAATLATSLAACGGGGGSGLRVGDPPASPPAPPPPEPPPAGTPPPIDAHLDIINAGADARDGITGAGYHIGVIDSGVNRAHPGLAGRVDANLTYIDPRTNNTSVDDVVGHGTAVALLAAGAPVGDWPGGVAPGARILSARIINDERPDDDGSGRGNEVTGALGIRGIHEDLVARGMRIMNNSWGGLYWTRDNVTAEIADEYRFFVRDHDGLVVFSTGNEGRSNPTDMAALPSQPGPGGTRPAADLERGWLAVAALDTFQPDELASYSNACGVAQSYCLAAPGTLVVPSPDATAGDISYVYGSGTSFAAPLVSGAAALVWEKFPYFDNDLVRQTLLGTATDLGEPGPDAVFGYGRLDVAKALGGPARFDWGDVEVSFSGQSAWTNDISGAGGLVKRGTGTLVMGTGKSVFDYTGQTRVEEGTLRIRGALEASDVHVAAGARLAGTPQLGGNLVNAGTVLVDGGGVDPAGFRIDGDYTQEAAGRLALVIGYGGLDVGGKATINGELQITGLRQGYVAKVREDVISAAEGVFGRFNTISLGPSVLQFSGSIVYAGYDVWLEISRLDVAATASTLGVSDPASLGAARRVETAFTRLDAGGASVVADEGFTRIAGDFQRLASSEEFEASLRSLSGEVHAAAMAATFDALDMGRRTLSGRFDQLAAGRGRAGGWMEAMGASAAPAAASGADAQLGGWMAGHDLHLEGNLVAGVAVAETRGDSRLQGLADRSRERQAQVQAYLGVQGEHAYLAGQLGSGQWQRQTDRELLVGASRHAVHADYDGSFSMAALETGWRFGTAGHGLVPYLGLEHARVASDGFHEEGAHGFGLRTSGLDARRSQAIAGLRTFHDWGRWRLQGHAEWQHTLSSDGLMPLASFVGVDSWSPLASTDPTRPGGLFGFSARSWLTANSQLGFSLDQRFGPRGDARQLSLHYLREF